eukprot:SAG22_NODE_15_length_32914_cov_20.713546_15_plen_75_part_00
MAKAEKKRAATKKKMQQLYALEELKEVLRAQYEAENPAEPQVEGGDHLEAWAGSDGIQIRKEEEEEEEEWGFDD